MTAPPTQTLIDDLLKSADPCAFIARHGLKAGPVLAEVQDGRKRGRLAKLFSFDLYLQKDFGEALKLAQVAHHELRETETLRNILLIVRENGDPAFITRATEQVEPVLEEPLPPMEKSKLAAIMGHNYAVAGAQDRSVAMGRRALEFRDQSVPEAAPFEGVKPAFDPSSPERNVIAFSLFGDQPRYCRTAIENAQAVRYVYPGWTCRYYLDDSVPGEMVERLRKLGATVVMRPRHDPEVLSGLFWRFEVASDPDVSFFLVRDVDSLLNVRERVAVDDFLAGPSLFHAMRDCYSHTECLLAGLWGGVGGVIDDMPGRIERYLEGLRSGPVIVGRRNQDQTFLRTEIWPHLRDVLCTHDGVFGFGRNGPRARTGDFPALGALPPSMHVGQDASVFWRKRPAAQ